MLNGLESDKRRRGQDKRKFIKYMKKDIPFCSRTENAADVGQRGISRLCFLMKHGGLAGEHSDRFLMEIIKTHQEGII